MRGLTRRAVLSDEEEDTPEEVSDVTHAEDELHHTEDLIRVRG